MSNNISSWPKKITVDKRIVTILSGSTYDNFPKALKELITNSYDADASEVNITIDLSKEMISVEDNGIGMNESDFDFYLRIAGKSRSKNEFTSSGRKRIGQFGVGFLSAFPFCKNYTIESKKKGSNEILFATIPNYKYLFKDDKLIDVDEIPIQGGKRLDRSQIDRQFTRIRLTGFSELTSAFFNEAYTVSKRRVSILKYPALKRLEWELSEDLPLIFEENPKLNNMFGHQSGLSFQVLLNSKKLFRNLPAQNILETHEGQFKRIGKIKLKYFIATDYEPIKPVEARFLKVRNLNVGVGKREAFGIGLEGRTFAYLAHLTGEIHILEGMNELINVSRDGFNFSQDYEELQEFFRERLRKWGYELDELAKDEKATDNSRKLKTLDAIDPIVINKRIERLVKKGYKITKDRSLPASTPFKIDKVRMEVHTPYDASEQVVRPIKINDRSLNLKLESWDIDNEPDFPACKISGRSIIINRNYPIFSKRKHLDIFIRIIGLLTIKAEERSITRKLYLEMLDEIEKTFSDY